MQSDQFGEEIQDIGSYAIKLTRNEFSDIDAFSANQSEISERHPAEFKLNDDKFK